MSLNQKKKATRSRASTKNPPKPLTSAEIALKYARDVVSGEIVACKWVRLACKRHIDDLQRSKSKDFLFRFDEAKANRACKFIQALPHAKGEWALRNETIKLEPWQLFNTCSLFGWVTKESGHYRFQEAYLCVPRKNAKSTWAAGVGLYKFAADGEYGAEVYSGATTEKQAWEVFRPAKQMAERTQGLRKAFGIQVNAKGMVIEANGSRFEPVIGKPGDGSSPSGALVDEYHEHPDDTLYDTMKTGMGARRNPLLLVITTAGSDRSGPCYQLQLDAQKMLEGQLKNERWFANIYTIDDGDSWQDETSLRKANPNYNVSVFGEYLLAQQHDAINSARKQNIFKTKHLNVWVNADVAWMNMAKWDASADPTLSVEQFLGEQCWDSLDLASRIDIASKALLFTRVVEGKTHYYAFLKHYINERAVEESRGSHYPAWANEGRLTVTPGSVTDFNWIIDDLIEDTKRFIVREVPHDAYQSQPLFQMASSRPDWNQNVQLVAIPQTVEKMSPAMKELEAIVLDGRFHHDGDPVLGWMVSNVVCHRDAKDNIYPRKQKEENKIDGVVALLMALNRVMLKPNSNSVYESRGLLTI